MTKLRQRLASEQGFTLIELLVVIVIIGILLAIAVPSYLGFKDRAEKKSASANVRAAIPSVEAYYSDCNTYGNATCDGVASTFDSVFLKSNYDQGLKVEDIKSRNVGTGTNNGYCITATSGDHRAKVLGPGGDVTVGTKAAIPVCS